MDGEIIVRGQARLSELPDRAVVRLDVDGEGSGRDDAYRGAARQAQRADEIVASHGGAVERAMTAALVVHPRTRWRKGEAVRSGWRASRTTTLEVVDFTHLGDLLAELSAVASSLSGPRWQLDPGNAVHDAVRQEAARDARRRADAYAAALGVELGPLRWVAEPGLRQGESSGGPSPMAMAAPMAAASRSVEQEPDVIDITPEEIPVHGSVEVGFGFVAPV